MNPKKLLAGLAPLRLPRAEGDANYQGSAEVKPGSGRSTILEDDGMQTTTCGAVSPRREAKRRRYCFAQDSTWFASARTHTLNQRRVKKIDVSHLQLRVPCLVLMLRTELRA